MSSSLFAPRLRSLCLAALLGAAAVRAEDPRRIDPVSPAGTPYPDAAEVARGQALTSAEASRRLRLQEVSAPHVSTLRREFAGRLAGIYRESAGDYRLVVRLKGEAPVADRWIGAGADRMRIQFLVGAPATLAEILERLAASMPALGARLPGLMGTGVDERTGEVMLDVHAVGDEVERVRAREAAIEQLLGHPVRLEISSSRMTDGRGSARAAGAPGPGTRPANGQVRRLARAARYPGYPHPGILAFHRESRALIQRVQADPAFAGWVFENENEPHAVVLFTGDAAARLACADGSGSSTSIIRSAPATRRTTGLQPLPVAYAGNPRSRTNCGSPENI
ncbi:MAG TPA: hypothetical protein VEA60_02855 [Allosphingosinicella sp.]|nr:hypothetical protein [Allosphingosinicella sp.]